MIVPDSGFDDKYLRILGECQVQMCDARLQISQLRQSCDLIINNSREAVRTYSPVVEDMLDYINILQR